MTNYEWIQKASIQELAKFLITSPDENGEPETIDDWNMEMMEAINWLRSEFNEGEYKTHLYNTGFNVTNSGIILPS